MSAARTIWTDPDGFSILLCTCSEGPWYDPETGEKKLVNPATPMTSTYGDYRSCHCGKPISYGYDGDPTHHRGMCAHCDAVRCDAYPGSCEGSEA